MMTNHKKSWSGSTRGIPGIMSAISRFKHDDFFLRVTRSLDRIQNGDGCEGLPEISREFMLLSGCLSRTGDDLNAFIDSCHPDVDDSTESTAGEDVNSHFLLQEEDLRYLAGVAQFFGALGQSMEECGRVLAAPSVSREDIAFVVASTNESIKTLLESECRFHPSLLKAVYVSRRRHHRVFTQEEQSVEELSDGSTS